MIRQVDPVFVKQIFPTILEDQNLVAAALLDRAEVDALPNAFSSTCQ